MRWRWRSETGRTEEKNESGNESSQPKTTETYLDYTCVLGEERVTCGGEQEKVNDVCGQQVMENVSFWKKRKSKSKLKCSTVIKNLLVKSEQHGWVWILILRSISGAVVA